VDNEVIELHFEGVEDDFNELEDVCKSLVNQSNIILRNGNKHLNKANEVLSEIIKIFKNLRPIIIQSEVNKEEIGGEIDNIFKYIIPLDIYISRNQKQRTIAIMCKYKFDLEHGIAIIYRNGKLSKIGLQDIII